MIRMAAAALPEKMMAEGVITFSHNTAFLYIYLDDNDDIICSQYSLHSRAYLEFHKLQLKKSL